MLQLTPEQTEQLKGEEPPRVVVDETEYVLVERGVYEKLKPLVEPEEIDPSLYEAEDLG